MTSHLPFVGGGLLLVAGLVAAYNGWRWRRERATIASREATDVLSVTPGPVELSGTARAGESGTVEAPFSDETALLAAWEVEEWTEMSNRSSWVPKGSGVDSVPFLVDDGTGEALVRADGAEVELDEVGEEEAVVRSRDAPPGRIREFLDREDTPGESTDVPRPTDVGKKDGRRRYIQRLLTPGDEVYVHGTATRETGEAWGGRDVAVVESADDGHPDADLFLVSDQSEEELLSNRGRYRRYLVGGTVLTVLGIAALAYGLVGGV